MSNIIPSPAGYTETGRPLIGYQKRRGLRSKVEKVGVPPCATKDVQTRELLVLGSGRSGTTSVAKLFQAAGLDLQHERVGAYGTASLFFTVDSDWYPKQPWTPGKVHYGERRSDYIFKHVLHVVRHARKVIPSMGAIFPAMNYEFFEDNDIIPMDVKSQLLRCAHAYFNLNKRADLQADMRFQIEDLPNQWYKIIKHLGLGRLPMPHMPHANKASGFRKREPLQWTTLHELDPTLCRSIMKMNKQYGYED